MSSDVTRTSRVGLPTLPTIVFEGKRYQQIMNGEREGLGQRTGLMAVVDLARGTRIVVKVYDYPRKPDREADVGDVFFKEWVLDAGRRELLIENERRQRFIYSIDDGSVRALD